MIVYILGEFPSNSEFFILNEILELKKRGMDIQLLALKNGGRNKSDQEPIQFNDIIYNTNLFSLSALWAHIYMIFCLHVSYFIILKNLLRTVNGFRALFNVIRDFSTSIYFLYRTRNKSIKLFHAHFISLPTTVAMIMSQLTKIPFSCTAHANDIYTGNLIDISRKISASEFVITCTLYNQIFLQKIIGTTVNKIIHLYHGLDLNQWPRKVYKLNYNSQRVINVLFVGRLVEKKGVIYLLEAIKQLKEAGYNTSCSIVGEGPCQHQAEKYIIENNLLKEVKMYGLLPQAQVKYFYRRADVFVLPCAISENGDRDGLPNVLIEALATGLPAISTSISAIEELISNKQTGILVSSKNSYSITSAILQLIQNPDLYRHISDTGRSKIESSFNITNTSDRLFELFTQWQTPKQISFNESKKE